MLGPAVTPADAAPGSTSPGGGLQSLAVLARDSKTLIKAAEALGVTGGCMREPGQWGNSGQGTSRAGGCNEGGCMRGGREGARTDAKRRWVKTLSDTPPTPRKG